MTTQERIEELTKIATNLNDKYNEAKLSHNEEDALKYKDLIVNILLQAEKLKMKLEQDNELAEVFLLNDSNKIDQEEYNEEKFSTIKLEAQKLEELESENQNQMMTLEFNNVPEQMGDAIILSDDFENEYNSYEDVINEYKIDLFEDNNPKDNPSVGKDEEVSFNSKENSDLEDISITSQMEMISNNINAENIEIENKELTHTQKLIDNTNEFENLMNTINSEYEKPEEVKTNPETKENKSVKKIEDNKEHNLGNKVKENKDSSRNEKLPNVGKEISKLNDNAVVKGKSNRRKSTKGHNISEIIISLLIVAYMIVFLLIPKENIFIEYRILYTKLIPKMSVFEIYSLVGCAISIIFIVWILLNTIKGKKDYITNILLMITLGVDAVALKTLPARMFTMQTYTMFFRISALIIGVLLLVKLKMNLSIKDEDSVK